MIKGVDVSNYQAASGWETGVDFAFVKLTEGTTYVNPKWVAQRQTARDAGLVVGFYHFVRPGSMVDQADYFLSQVALRPGDVLCLDWEDQDVSSAEKDAWISYVQGRTGHRVVLYCNGYFWKTLDRSSFAGDGLWIATAGYAAGEPNISSPWVLHQYSTSGGIDHDVAQFDSRADMLAWAVGEDLMAAVDLTTAAIDAVAKRVLTVDGVIVNDGTDSPTNPFIVLATAVRSLLIVARRTEAKVDALALATASVAADLDVVRGVLAAVDLSNLPDEIAAKLAGLKFEVTVTEGA